MLDGQSDFPFLDTSPFVSLSRRQRIKIVGGMEYDALLSNERAALAKWKAKNPDRWREFRRQSKCSPERFKDNLCSRARARGRKRGLPSTIQVDDLTWPSHCPVLGLQLDYPTIVGQRKGQTAQANWPSLDRFDPTKGYVPGNVFVISYRANTLKNSATYEEILRVAKYLSRRPK